MTVQGLRKSVRLLEDELKVSLYHRGKEQLSFTKAGELFFQFCVNELEQHQKMLDTMDELSRGRRAELNLAFSTASFGIFAPQFPKRMQESPDGGRIAFLTRPEHEIIKGLKAGHYDYGITWGNPDPDVFAYEPIVDISPYVIVNRKNELAKETHIPISRIQSEKIIFFDAKIQPYHSLKKASLLNGVEPNFTFITNEAEVMLNYLKGDMGISFVLPNATALYDKSLFHFVRVDDVVTPLGACCLKQHRITAEEQHVIDLLKQIAEENIRC